MRVVDAVLLADREVPELDRDEVLVLGVVLVQVVAVAHAHGGRKGGRGHGHVHVLARVVRDEIPAE